MLVNIGKNGKRNKVVQVSIVGNSVVKVPFSLLLHFHDCWINYYNFTPWRPNCTHLLTLVIQTRLGKKKIFKILVADMGSSFKRKSFKTVSHNDLLTINNESTFFWSKMGQIKHKPLRTRDFFSGSLWEITVSIWNKFFWK